MPTGIINGVVVTYNVKNERDVHVLRNMDESDLTNAYVDPLECSQSTYPFYKGQWVTLDPMTGKITAITPGNPTGEERIALFEGFDYDQEFVGYGGLHAGVPVQNNTRYQLPLPEHNLGGTIAVIANPSHGYEFEMEVAPGTITDFGTVVGTPSTYLGGQYDIVVDADGRQLVDLSATNPNGRLRVAVDHKAFVVRTRYDVKTLFVRVRVLNGSALLS